MKRVLCILVAVLMFGGSSLFLAKESEADRDSRHQFQSPHRPGHRSHEAWHRPHQLGRESHRVWHHRPWSSRHWGYSYGYPYGYPYGSPYTPYYPGFPFYYSPPVVVEREPQPYIQQHQYYWYFCQNPEGYWPYIRECPGGWLQVVPQTTPPGAQPAPR